MSPYELLNEATDKAMARDLGGGSAAPSGVSGAAIDRRRFVAGAAGTGLAVVAAALASCAPQPSDGEQPAQGDARAQAPGNDAPQATSGTAAAASSSDAIQVFFTADISSAGLQRAFDALGVQPHGREAVHGRAGRP